MNEPYEREGELPPEPDVERVPNLMRLGEISSDMAQIVTTDVIEPTVFSQSFCRFTLDRRVGFLHSNSKITLSLVPQGNDAEKTYYPLNIGVGSLIQSCRLMIGQKVVSSVEDFAHFHAYQSMFLTNENNKEREQYLSQRMMAHKQSPTDLTTPRVANKIGIDNGIDIANADQRLNRFQEMNGNSADDITDSPVYSIYLSDLFPMLREYSLPAYLIKEPIFVELTWTPYTSNLHGTVQSLRQCCQSTGDVDLKLDIDQNEVRMIYDSITYDGEIMRQYAEQNKNLTFQYKEYNLAKRTGDETDFTDLVFPVGGNGMLCSKVIYGVQSNARYMAKSLVNGFHSIAPTVAHNLSVNLLYNDRYEFSVDRDNLALIFSTTQQSEGQVPMLCRGEYGNEATTEITANTFEGNAQSTALLRHFCWNSIRLNRGQRINTKGIDLIYKTSLAGGTNYTLRAWVEHLKIASLQDGEFSCYNA